MNSQYLLFIYLFGSGMLKSIENPDIFVKGPASVLLKIFCSINGFPFSYSQMQIYNTPSQNTYELDKHWLFSIPWILMLHDFYILLTCTILSNFPV